MSLYDIAVAKAICGSGGGGSGSGADLVFKVNSMFNNDVTSATLESGTWADAMALALDGKPVTARVYYNVVYEGGATSVEMVVRSVYCEPGYNDRVDVEYRTYDGKSVTITLTESGITITT